MQDTLSDMLVRIKNAQIMGHEKVFVIDARLNRRVCDVLVEEGYILDYLLDNSSGKPLLMLKLKYYLGRPVIANIKRVSKSSKRVYKKSVNIPKIIDGFGIWVISTSKGVMSHMQAIRQKIGGEVLFWVN